MTPIAQTLTQHLAAGRLPLSDAVRFAVQIVDAVRHAHEEGRYHGALSPDSVLLTSTGVELLPPPASGSETFTRFTAPERLKGQPPDARSDIFSLGALLYEIFSGKPAFAGETSVELAASIANSTPPPVGDAAIDHLVLNCLVKNPAGRWQRVQQVHMELKIVLFSARRAQAEGLPRRQDFVLQSDFRQLETRLVSRLDQQYGETTAEVRHLAAELPLLESHLTSRLEQRCGEAAADVRHLAAGLPVLESRLAGRLDHQDAVLADFGQTVGALGVRIPEFEARMASRLEEHDEALVSLRGSAANIEGLRLVNAEHHAALAAASDALEHVQAQVVSIEAQLAAASQNSLAGEMESLGATVKSQAAAIESIRAAMARTDDFMERVVEALESLQNIVLEQAHEHAVA